MADLPPPPPSTKQISARKKTKYDKFFQGKEAIARVQASAAASAFFDKDSPNTRAKRQDTRADFEYFIQGVYGLDATSDVYNSSTITQRTKEWLTGKHRCPVRSHALCSQILLQSWR